MTDLTAERLVELKGHAIRYAAEAAKQARHADLAAGVPSGIREESVQRYKRDARRHLDIAAALTRLRVLERVMQRVDATCCEDSSVWIAEALEEVQRGE